MLNMLKMTMTRLLNIFKC